MVKNKNRKKLLVIVLIVLLFLVLGSAAAYVALEDEESLISPPSPTQNQDINYDPPSEQEIHQGDKSKDDIINKQNNNPPSSSSTKKEVSVVITNWGETGGRFEVGSYANTLDQAGNCSLLLKRGSTVLNGKSKAVQNPSTMSCGSLSVNASKITVGQWEATVSYSSATAKGSTTRMIEVQ